MDRLERDKKEEFIRRFKKRYYHILFDESKDCPVCLKEIK
jgi:hypothetical protein